MLSQCWRWVIKTQTHLLPHFSSLWKKMQLLMWLWLVNVSHEKSSPPANICCYFYTFGTICLKCSSLVNKIFLYHILFYFVATPLLFSDPLSLCMTDWLTQEGGASTLSCCNWSILESVMTNRLIYQFCVPISIIAILTLGLRHPVLTEMMENPTFDPLDQISSAGGFDWQARLMGVKGKGVD